MMKVLIIDCDLERRHTLASRFRKFDTITIDDRPEVFLDEKDNGEPGKSPAAQVWIDIAPYDLVMLHIGVNRLNKPFYLEKCSDFKGMLLGYTGVDKPGWFVGPNFLEFIGSGKGAADYFYIEEFCDYWESQNKLNFNVLRTGKERGDENSYALLNNLYQCLTSYLSILHIDDQHESSYKPNIIQEGLKFERLFRPTENRLQLPLEFKGKADEPGKAGWYWFDYTIEDIAGKSFNSLAQDIPELAQCPHLETVYNIIRGESLNKKDGLSLRQVCKGWKQDDYTNLFYKAHREYLNVSNKHSSMEKLDRAREDLNHNGLVNDFLNVIGNARQTMTVEEKYQGMFLLWKYIKKGEKGLATNKKKVERGLALWWELEKRIEAFFSTLPGKYNFQGTGKFQKAGEEARELCKIIGKTVRRFAAVNELPEDESALKEELTLFWETALKLKDTLTDMKINRHFDSYFKYVLQS